MHDSLLNAWFQELARNFSFSVLAHYIDFNALGWVLFFFTLLSYVISKDQWLRLRMELQQYAMFDLLTGLPNRRLFQDRIELLFKTSQRKQEKFALILGDLDHFKEVNDTLGHHAGDELLRQVAGALGKAIRGGDTVARLGGDEFAFIIQSVKDPAELEIVAERILKTFAKPTVIDGKTFPLGISLGIVIYPEHGVTLQDLLRRADMAMYAAKQKRNAYAFYQPDIEPATTLDSPRAMA